MNSIPYFVPKFSHFNKKIQTKKYTKKYTRLGKISQTRGDYLKFEIKHIIYL